MRNILLLSSVLIFLCACKEENINVPRGHNDGVPPGKVSNVSYTATPGGAIITFDIPADDDLFYIKADYVLDNGLKMEARTSSYMNMLEVEGYANTEAKTLKIYAVDRLENVGEPVSFEFNPEEPPYITAFESLNVQESFGGIFVDMENMGRGNLMLDILTEDENGELYIHETKYTSVSEYSFAVRGFEPEQRKFGIVVRDRWDNVSDTLYTTVTPWMEIMIPKDKFRSMSLTNDTKVTDWGCQMERIWNDIHDVANATWDMCHSGENGVWPQWFTFDMGTTAKLSRYIYWQRLERDYIYQHGNPKKWEIWGRADTPPTDGSWDGWFIVAESESFKPSGLPPGINSSEDLEYADAGEEFLISQDCPPVRYLRFKCLETMSGAKFMHFSELSFFGTPQD